ncbi:response regulator transcription factor [Streptomyces fuscigenes]|uniref:response regulator transcription factor n=1 Tax=Streptomyces fuscigenes TaxID=1528880 RepID=UPI001F3F260E|nr:response regulator transcription factor [Streptomyces fuscigenes]MCF3962854.1 response regulator transcription factor [Streptomyces fuscigenes]
MAETAAALRVLVADDNPVVRAGLTALLAATDGIEVVADAADGGEAYERALRTRPDVVLLDVRMPRCDGLTALPYLVPLAAVLMMTYSGEPATVTEALRRGAGGYLVHGEFTAAQLTEAVRDVSAGRPHLTPTASSAVLEALRAGSRHGSAPPTTTSMYTAANAPSGEGLPEARTDRFSTHVGRRTSPADSGTTSLQEQFNVGHSSGMSRREVEIMGLIAAGLTNQQIAAACFISQKTVKNHINRIFAKLGAGSRGEAIARWHGTARRGPEDHG